MFFGVGDAGPFVWGVHEVEMDRGHYLPVLLDAQRSQGHHQHEFYEFEGRPEEICIDFREEGLADGEMQEVVSLLPVKGSLFSTGEKYRVVPVELHDYAILELRDQVLAQSLVIDGEDEIGIEGGLHGIKTNIHNILNLQPQITRQIVIPSLLLSLNQHIISPTTSPTPTTIPHDNITIHTTSQKLTIHPPQIQPPHKKYTIPSHHSTIFRALYNLTLLNPALGGRSQLNYLMADISLDDLIKKDKEQHKANKPAKKFGQNKPAKKNFQGGNDRDQSKPARQDGDSRPFKKKIIKKNFNEHKNQQREQKPQQQQPPKQFQPKPPKQEQDAENKEKFLRTLKVMGLSPDFTNEQLYKLFATQGAMEKCLIEQDNFGRSLTTAIVKYHSPESARSAIQNLNRHKLNNCILTVQPYKNVKK